MDNSLNYLYVMLAIVFVLLMTGCTAQHSTWVTQSGQIMDGTNQPIYPELSYSPVTMESLDANGNPN